MANQSSIVENDEVSLELAATLLELGCPKTWEYLFAILEWPTPETCKRSTYLTKYDYIFNVQYKNK